MNKNAVAVIVSSVVLIGALGWIFLVKAEPRVVKENTQSLPPNGLKVWQSQVSEQESVSVEVKPEVLAAGLGAKFSISFNTHSVELDYDLLKVAELTDDQGNILKPLSWTGGTGGHHLSGELNFPAIAPGVKQVKLTLYDISAVDREFEWKL